MHFGIYDHLVKNDIQICERQSSYKIICKNLSSTWTAALYFLYADLQIVRKMKASVLTSRTD